jgi:hypothetical protein
MAWEEWSYMACFAAAYLIVRGKVPRATAVSIHEASLSTGAALAVIWCALKLWTTFLKYDLGVDYKVGYGAIDAHVENVAALPHWVNQVVGIGLGFEGVLPIALFVFLMSRWRHRLARVAVVLILTYTLLWYVFLNMGSRTWLFLPFAAAGMMYVRNVRRVKVWMVACGIVGSLAAFWAFNEMRSGVTLAQKVQQLKAFVGDADSATRYSRKDEFQLWLSSNMEVRELRNRELLPPVPWQIYAIDLLLFIPAQILPFEKIDPVTWFDNVETARTGLFEFFMYSPIAQGYLGLGVPEIMLRGIFLGVAFAMMHRAYVRRSRSFLANVIYLWLMLFCYISLRNNTGNIFVSALHRLVPFVIVLSVLRWAVASGGARLAKRGAPVASSALHSPSPAPTSVR